VGVSRGCWGVTSVYAKSPLNRNARQRHRRYLVDRLSHRHHRPCALRWPAPSPISRILFGYFAAAARRWRSMS
jgi:hypothetical protein